MIGTKLGGTKGDGIAVIKEAESREEVFTPIEVMILLFFVSFQERSHKDYGVKSPLLSRNEKGDERDIGRGEGTRE